jgi:hypothetical protein
MGACAEAIGNIKPGWSHASISIKLSSSPAAALAQASVAVRPLVLPPKSEERAMFDQSILMWNLKCVEGDIFEIEGRVTLQYQRIERHNRQGGVPEPSLDLLTLLKQALSAYHQRRRRILREWLRPCGPLLLVGLHLLLLLLSECLNHETL